MICANCGNAVGYVDICPVCGSDLKVQINAERISAALYNEGLGRAEIRDLSGAIELLERSLKFNKNNIDARNLLGLVYLETGEAVSALSEWVISKNLQTEDNIADEYIQKVQANPQRLQTIQDTIKRYNRALDVALDGQDDVAILMLKKVISANPKLIKAYLLLALLHMKRGEYEKARRVIKRSLPIDRTNPTTLRFIKEIDERTGTATNMAERQGGRQSKRNDELDAESGATLDNDQEFETSARIRPRTVPRLTPFMAFISLTVGLVIGILVIGFIVLPSVSHTAERKANEQVATALKKTATQGQEIESLKNEMESQRATVDEAKNQIDQANKKVDAYEKLFQANSYQAAGEYEMASGLLGGIDKALLSADAAVIYDQIAGSINEQLYAQFAAAGIAAYEAADYPTAIDNLSKAKAIKGDDYNLLSYLAHSYRMTGKTDEAIAIFQEIVQLFPNSHRAVTAQNFIDTLRDSQTTAGANAQQQAAEQGEQQTQQNNGQQQSGQDGQSALQQNNVQQQTEQQEQETPDVVYMD